MNHNPCGRVNILVHGFLGVVRIFTTFSAILLRKLVTPEGGGFGNGFDFEEFAELGVLRLMVF